MMCQRRGGFRSGGQPWVQARGTLGAAAGAHATPWPATVVDLSLPAGRSASLPLASSERRFAYILRGEIELGRNQVRLNRDNVAWVERTSMPADINSLTVRVAKDSRVLLFSSPVFGEAGFAAIDNSAGCGSDPADELRVMDDLG